MTGPARTEAPGTAAEALRSSASRQAELVRSGEVSARELVEASLEAIERLDPAVNAFATVAAEQALAEAKLVQPGDERPLCGVPFAAKDLLSATAGLPTTQGTAAFGDWVADHDAAHVRRLREAGAILVGKTNAPEMGVRPVTESARYGATRNPWNLDLATGGSSGGSAAAVAAGMVGLADGSDLGGSIRIPAASCGVIGLKPTRGRVSMGPDFGDFTAGMAVDGAIARTTLDVALALDAISGYEPGDHHFLDPTGRAPGAFTTAAGRSPGRVPIRLVAAAPLDVPVDAEPRAAVMRAGDRLAVLGHDLREGAPDWEDEAFAPAWGTFVKGSLQHMVHIFERLHGRAVDLDVLESANREWFADAPPVGLIEWLEARERLVEFARRVLRSWQRDEVLLTPTLTRLPAPIDTLRSKAGVTDDAVRFSATLRIWNVTGQPAITLPLHQTPDGVPVGVQLVGAPGREDLLLSLAAQLEADPGWAPVAPVPAERLAAALLT
jgi:amidase